MTDAWAALTLQLEWGADEAIGEIALDRTTPARRPPPSRPAEPAPAPSLAPAKPIAAATSAALAEAIDSSDGAGLRGTATHTVRWSGAETASCMLIAEAPSADDDRSGVAFSGPLGQRLDRILLSAGLNRTNLLITHLVPWRPPGGRKLTDREIAFALPYLHALLGLVQPKFLLLAGAAPVKALTGRTETVRKLRGTWLTVMVSDLKLTSRALPLPPIEQWLDSPRSKELLWSDLIAYQKGVATA